MVKRGVLVCLGYYNKIPQTGWLIYSRNVLLTVPEPGSPRSEYQNVWSNSVEGPLPVCTVLISHCILPSS